MKKLLLAAALLTSTGVQAIDSVKDTWILNSSDYTYVETKDLIAQLSVPTENSAGMFMIILASGLGDFGSQCVQQETGDIFIIIDNDIIQSWIALCDELPAVHYGHPTTFTRKVYASPGEYLIKQLNAGKDVTVEIQGLKYKIPASGFKKVYSFMNKPEPMDDYTKKHLEEKE